MPWLSFALSTPCDGLPDSSLHRTPPYDGLPRFPAVHYTLCEGSRSRRAAYRFFDTIRTSFCSDCYSTIAELGIPDLLIRSFEFVFFP